MGDTLCGECVGGVCDVMCGIGREGVYILLMALSAALLWLHGFRLCLTF